MTKDASGWPDPARPGVPVKPEKDGAHELRFPSGNQRIWIWRASPAPFWISDTSRMVYPRDIVSFEATYIGPCLTPAEVEARIAEARRAALEDAAQWHDEQQKLLVQKAREISALDMRIGLDLHVKAADHRRHAAAIRALGEKELSSEEIIRADRDAWPDRQADDVNRALGEKA